MMFLDGLSRRRPLLRPSPSPLSLGGSRQSRTRKSVLPLRQSIALFGDQSPVRRLQTAGHRLRGLAQSVLLFIAPQAWADTSMQPVDEFDNDDNEFDYDDEDDNRMENKSPSQL